VILERDEARAQSLEAHRRIEELQDKAEMRPAPTPLATFGRTTLPDDADVDLGSSAVKSDCECEYLRRELEKSAEEIERLQRRVLSSIDTGMAQGIAIGAGRKPPPTTSPVSIRRKHDLVSATLSVSPQSPGLGARDRDNLLELPSSAPAARAAAMNRVQLMRAAMQDSTAP